MFVQLIESRSVRRRSPAGFAASVALHGIIVAGALIGTSHASRQHQSRPPDVIVRFLPAVPLPPRVAPVARQSSPSVPAGPSIINVPSFTPDVIPPIDPLRAIINTDQPFELRVGTPSRAGNPALAPADPDAPLLVEQVEVPVVLDTRSPMPRYPQLLRDAGVEGVARLQFVIDTLGRVEPRSVKVVETTHPAFALAVQAALPHMRFAPARVGSHAVRQLVEFPLQFRLRR
jgi:protein TonB